MTRKQIVGTDYNCSERAISSWRMKNPCLKKVSTVHIYTAGREWAFEDMVACVETVMSNMALDTTGTVTAGTAPCAWILARY